MLKKQLWIGLAIGTVLLAGCSQQPTSLAAPVANLPSKSEQKAEDNTPVNVVTQYYAAAARSDYQTAWNLIHPGEQKHPSAEIAAQLKKDFLAQKPGPALVSAKEGQRLDEYKIYVNQIRYADVATVSVKQSDGKERLVHLVKDQDGLWRLFWLNGDESRAGLE